MAGVGAREKVAYGRRVNVLVTQIADNFTSKDCEKLCFIYSALIFGSFKEKHSGNPLKLLEKLRDEGVFCNDRPGELAKLMKDLDLPLMKSRVDAFIAMEENAQVISSLNFQQRPLPAIPVPCTSIGSPTPALECTSPGVQQRSGPPSSQDEEDNYTFFVRHSPPVPLSAIQKRISFQTSRPSTQDSSSDDGIYWEPYAILKSTSKEHFPQLQERMKLLVKPIRNNILAGTETTIASKELKCPFPQSSYSLVINTGNRSNDPYVSAKLYLLPGFKLERKDHLMSQLQLRQRSKKTKLHQDLYMHSSLLNNLPSSSRPSELVHPVQEGAVPVQEGAVPIHTEATPPRQPAQEGICVASFPAIISHEHFLDKKLVNRPYLTIVFTLVQFRQE